LVSPGASAVNLSPVLPFCGFASIRWEDFNTARADLRATDAFLDANEAEDKGIRLMLPKEVRP
jgi:hypothetical protein